LILAAIAIPNLIRARISANESSAVSAVRSIMTAESAYAVAYPSVGYATVLGDLSGAAPCSPSSTGACLIDTVLASGTKEGYFFNAAGTDPSSIGVNTTFIVGAAPVQPNYTGMRRFCGMTDGTIHYDFNPGLSSAIPDLTACTTPPFAGQTMQ